MLDLVSHMQVGIVDCFSLPHCPHYFQPSVGQGAKRGVMSSASPTLAIVVNASPLAIAPSLIYPMAKDVAEEFAACSPHMDGEPFA